MLSISRVTPESQTRHKRKTKNSSSKKMRILYCKLSVKLKIVGQWFLTANLQEIMKLCRNVPGIIISLEDFFYFARSETSL